MYQCEAVRKRGSSDQCPNKALGLLTLCGMHVKTKNVQRWKEVHVKSLQKLVRFQAICRGWFVRRFFKLAGPGVLRRTGVLYANTEELVSGEDVLTASPRTYFAFVENGKVFWFEIGTLWKWIAQSVYPTNPYTKSPIDSETLHRLRENRSMRIHRRMRPIPSFIGDVHERTEGRWTVLTHLFRAHGFRNVHPVPMMDITKHQYKVVFQLLKLDVDAYYLKNIFHAKLLKTLASAIHLSKTQPAHSFIEQSVQYLYGMCMCVKDPYSLLYSILSAIHMS